MSICMINSEILGPLSTLSSQNAGSQHFYFTRQKCVCHSVMFDSWTVAHQTPPSMGFSRQEYKNGLPFPSPGDLPDPGIKLRSPALQADSLLSRQESGVIIFQLKKECLLELVTQGSDPKSDCNWLLSSIKRGVTALPS